MNQTQQIVRKDGSMLRVPANPFADVARRFDASEFKANLLGASGSNFRDDAVSGIALARELENLSMVVSKAIYSDLTAGKAFPLAAAQPPAGSTSHRWKEADWTKGRVSSSYSDIGQGVQLSVASTAQNLRAYITHCGYDLGDVQSALLANIPLPAWKLEGARRAIEEAINSDVWLGDAATGIQGLANTAGITTAVVPNGAGGSPLWVNKTPDEIEADCVSLLNALVNQVADAASLMPNRLALSTQSYAILATTARGQFATTTILEYLQKAFKGFAPDFELTSHPELTTGAPGDAAAKWMIAYRYDPMVAGRLLSVPTTFLAPQLEAFSTVIHAHAQAGGLEVRKPVAFLIRRGM